MCLKVRWWTYFCVWLKLMYASASKHWRCLQWTLLHKKIREITDDWMLVNHKMYLEQLPRNKSSWCCSISDTVLWCTKALRCCHWDNRPFRCSKGFYRIMCRTLDSHVTVWPDPTQCHVTVWPDPTQCHVTTWPDPTQCHVTTWPDPTQRHVIVWPYLTQCCSQWFPPDGIHWYSLSIIHGHMTHASVNIANNSKACYL